MNVESVLLDDLSLDPANVRKHDDRNLSAIKASLVRFGQQKPIVVTSEGMIVAGNGTLEAARSLGWERLNVVRTELKRTEATAYGIADNRTAELASWDDDGLAGMLNALVTEDESLLEAAGFTEAEYKIIEDSTGGVANPPWEREWEGMPEYAHEDQTSWHQLVVHFANKEDYLFFGSLIQQTLTDKTRSIWYPHVEPAVFKTSSYCEAEE